MTKGNSAVTWTKETTVARLEQSVVAVPPLARTSDGRISVEQNRRMIQWLEQAGIRTLLYGGNALLYHIRPSEYAELCRLLVEYRGADTWMIPSVGPAYGMMMDQVEILRDFDFPTVMILPQKEIADELGIVRGIEDFCNRFERPIVLYLKHDRWLSPSLVSKLVENDMVCWIKYAVVRENPEQDRYLEELLESVDSKWMVSGIGEQPAIIHRQKFGMSGYTSGCVCVAPRESMRMLMAMNCGDFLQAESIRSKFVELESLRNAIHPIRVLHRAVELAGIVESGPILPMLGGLTSEDDLQVKKAACELRSLEH